MFFRTYAQLVNDVEDWIRSHPLCLTCRNYIAIAGLGRAGMLVATIIGQRVNTDVMSVDELLAGKRPWEKPTRRVLAQNRFVGGAGTVLVVDDTVWSGGTMKSAIDLIESKRFDFDVAYGAVYVSSMDKRTIDVNYQYKVIGNRTRNKTHLFEWNWHSHPYNQESLWDMDGVICENCPDHCNDRVDEVAYLNEHILTAAPLYLPGYPVKSIVTGRLEKYRKPTEDWLGRHGVRYENLIMAQYDTAAERDAADIALSLKAVEYERDEWAPLFVESCRSQAVRIAEKTSRPVLCVDTKEFFNGEEI